MRFRVILLLMAAFYCFYPSSTLAEEIGVRILMQNPENYPGGVTVIGVVSQVVTEANVIGLIDLKEFEECNKVSCAKLILPVRWEGTMPEVGKQLAATGTINREGKRYLFVATDLKVVPAD